MATSITYVSFHACPFLYAVICYVFGTYFILCLMSTSIEREFETCHLSWSFVCTDALLLLNDVDVEWDFQIRDVYKSHCVHKRSFEKHLVMILLFVQYCGLVFNERI